MKNSRCDRYGFRYAFLIIIIISGSALGQVSSIKFERYSTQEGLSQSSILDIYQDEEGFMWFGTYAGLNRFDGYNFKWYQYNPNDSTTISDNHVRSICQDSTGILWVGTTGGINRFFTDTEEFVQFRHDTADSNSLSNNTIYKLMEDREGTLWIGTWGGGLDQMVRKKGNYKNERDVQYQFIHHMPVPGENSISSAKISDIALAPDGTLWLGTRNGLNRYNNHKDEFTVCQHHPNNPNSISHNNVSAVCVDLKGNIWAGTWGGGLNMYNPRTDEFTRYHHDPDDEYSLGHEVIMSLRCDYSGSIWVGTFGGGLNRVVFPGEEDEELLGMGPENRIWFLRYMNKENDLSSISGNSIYSIYEDQTGIMWVGTDWSGANRFEKENVKFRHYYAEPGNPNSLSNNIVFALTVVNDHDELWIGTQKGLNIYDRKSHSYSAYYYDPLDTTSISHEIIRTILEDREGNIWVGTLQGFNKYLREENKFRRYYFNYEDLGATNVLCLFEDSEGMIWIGTYGSGIARFDPKTERILPCETNSEFKSLISNSIVRVITEDETGKLWFGTEKAGLFRLDRTTGEFVQYIHDQGDTNSLSNNHVTDLYFDHDGDLWIATSLGINKMITDNEGAIRFKKYYQENGLPSDYINGIIEDDYDNLWFITSNGLVRFERTTEIFTSFTPEHGIQDHEFSIRAIDKDPESGEIYAGGINGYNVFHPGRIRGNRIAPDVKIVDLKIFNTSVGVGETLHNQVLLPRTISSLDQLELSPKEYVVTFEYAALHYQSPEGNQYAFMLEGFDKDWNYVGNQRIATYTNLPPGKYVFKVKAANNDGIWNETPVELAITVRPPWWKTLFFKLLVVFLSVSFIVSFYLLRIRIMKKRQKDLQDMVLSRTVELNDVNVQLEEKQEEISLQNDELMRHRNELEKLIDERTAELKEAKSRAEDADQLKSAFLANMSHEVRTPMNAIIGFAALLEDESVEKEEKEYFIKMIRNNGDTLLTLIDDILDISIIEANQLDLDISEFCLDEIFQELYSYYDLRNDRNIKLELFREDPEDKVYLKTDQIRFRQVMNNLLTNAFKYTEAGYIRFGYRKTGKKIRIFVEDSGVGIEDGDSEKVFDYFHKLNISETKLYQGTGIGLSICKKLVELMESEIRLESQPGKGSMFYFDLPGHGFEDEQEGRFSDKKIREDLRGISILIAEDEPNNYKLVERILSKTGADLHWAQNGLEAVEYVESNFAKKNLLVIMDIKMPIMNGIEAIREIKKIDKSIPVIAVTAYAQASEKTRIMKERFDHYISKPLHANHLKEIVYYFATELTPE